MSGQFIRFICAGALNTVVTVVLFYFLSPLLGYLLAYSLAYVFGIAISYLLNTAFVFAAARNWKSAIIYPLIYIVMYLYGMAMLILLVDKLALKDMAALALIILSSVPISFFLARWFFAFFSPK